MQSSEQTLATNPTAEIVKRALLAAFLLFTFLIGVKTLSSSFGLMGGDFADGLLSLSSHPFIALLAGMLATALIQSSSATTSIIVGLVSSGAINLEGAVPLIMGANLGTSVTNTFVSLGYIQNKNHFKRAFSAATVHDFFNLLSVAVLLPIELATGFLSKMAMATADFLFGSSVSGLTFSSPLKAAIKPFVNFIESFITAFLGLEGIVSGLLMAVIAGGIILFSLTMIVKTMKVLIESNKAQVINKLLSHNCYITIILGALLTMAVQSSSITTSLLIPMAGSGLLTIEAIFPITVGANIGTTATALLAALIGNVAGLAIALVHLYFNLFGTIIWFSIPVMRKIPIALAEKLATSIEKSRVLGPSYVALTFFGIPIGLIYFF